MQVPIYMPNTLQLGGPYMSLTFAILAKGNVFFSDLRLKAFVRIAVRICRIHKQINTARGYCWGPSSSEGPQKLN
jgi:hypothetical protein